MEAGGWIDTRHRPAKARKAFPVMASMGPDMVTYGELASGQNEVGHSAANGKPCVMVTSTHLGTDLHGIPPNFIFLGTLEELIARSLHTCSVPRWFSVLGGVSAELGVVGHNQQLHLPV